MTTETIATEANQTTKKNIQKPHTNFLRKKNKKPIPKKTIASTKEQEFHKSQTLNNYEEKPSTPTDPFITHYNNIYSAIRNSSTFNLLKFKETVRSFVSSYGDLKVTSSSSGDLLSYSILYNNIDSLNYLLEFPWEFHNEKAFQNFAIKNAAYKNPDVYLKTIELYKEHDLINNEVVEYIFNVIPKNMFRKENINITTSLMEEIYLQTKKDNLPIQLFKELIKHKNFNFIQLFLENDTFKNVIKKNITTLSSNIDGCQYKHQINKLLDNNESMKQPVKQDNQKDENILTTEHKEKTLTNFFADNKMPIVKIKKIRKISPS